MLYNTLLALVCKFINFFIMSLCVLSFDSVFLKTLSFLCTSGKIVDMKGKTKKYSQLLIICSRLPDLQIMHMWLFYLLVLYMTAHFHKHGHVWTRLSSSSYLKHPAWGLEWEWQKKGWTNSNDGNGGMECCRYSAISQSMYLATASSPCLSLLLHCNVLNVLHKSL